MSPERRVVSAKEAFEVVSCRLSSGRRVFVTESLNHGLGPGTMQQGVVLVILFSGATPFLVRPTGTEGAYWFAGECWVEEWTDGQAIGLIDKDRLTHEWFVMRCFFFFFFPKTPLQNPGLDNISVLFAPKNPKKIPRVGS